MSCGLKCVRIVVVMPVGPGEDIDDTLESLRAFLDPSRAIVLVDDTGTDELAATTARLPDVAVVPAPGRAQGAHGGLWVKIAAGYAWACGRYRFDVLLRMDTDAVMLRPGIEDAALGRFHESPGVGLLGSYLTGPDGRARDFTWAAKALGREAGLLGWRHPRLRARLRALMREAAQSGYVPGEHALGGAFIHSGAAVRALSSRGLLDLPEMAASRLGEDMIFALLTLGAGFRIGDFGGPGDPLALRWIGLPDHPAALLAGSALITHSVRSYGDLDEHAIRAQFAEARRNRGVAHGGEGPAL